MNKWRRQTITILLVDGDAGVPVEISALVSGPLVVHERCYAAHIFAVDLWDVTHLATGAAVCCANSRRDAIKAARRLIRADIAWPASLDIPAHEGAALLEKVIAALEDMLRDGRVALLSRAERDAYEYACHLYDEGEGLLLSAYLSDLKETRPNLWRHVNARVARYIDAWESEIQTQERGG